MNKYYIRLSGGYDEQMDERKELVRLFAVSVYLQVVFCIEAESDSAVEAYANGLTKKDFPMFDTHPFIRIRIDKLGHDGSMPTSEQTLYLCLE